MSTLKDDWANFLIPIIAGCVGYATNVLALEMTFYAIEFLGIELFRLKNEPWGLFGWQGIIPTKAEKIASISFDLMTTRLINVKDTFQRVDAARFSEVMEDGMLLIMDEIINTVAEQYMGANWEALPKEVRDDVVVQAESEAGDFMAGFIRDLQDHFDDVVDLKTMCVKACVENKHLLIKIFQECGDKEFVFIRQSGFYFGFLFGLFQMAVWFIYPQAWILPVCGFVVGWFTNFVALKVIFRPLEPIHMCGFVLHGIFLKRQKEVSEVYARVICTEILHIPAIFNSILTGSLSSNFHAMLRAHTLVFVDKLTAELKPMAIAAMGSQKYAEMKENLAKKVIEGLPSIIDQSFEYTTRALDIEGELRDKMAALSPGDFEGVLHPAFQEDEIQLIVLGGILGAIVGAIQILFLS